MKPEKIAYYSNILIEALLGASFILPKFQQ